jgi:cytochrome c-type biogenesis protein CcmE
MNPKRKRRLVATGLLVLGVSAAVGLTLMALQENINVFYSSQSSLDVVFDLTDTAQTVTIAYTGILPDLFREGQGIVALGKMTDGTFVANQVLAKHDETYMPPEVSEAIKRANAAKYGKQAGN